MPNLENIALLKDFLQTESARFNMAVWLQDPKELWDGGTMLLPNGRPLQECGTAMCLGGACGLLRHIQAGAKKNSLGQYVLQLDAGEEAEWLGISYNHADELFHPYYIDENLWKYISVEEALIALDRACDDEIDLGEIWDHVQEDVLESRRLISQTS